MIPRVIAKLDVKSEYVVKPIHFEGLRKIGDPQELLLKYYEQGADEIFYIDIVASLYQREFNIDQLSHSGRSIYVPFAVGGGVRSIDDFSKLFHNGADKVVINTHALQEDADLIDRAAHIFGSQAVVLNVEAKQWGSHWECYSDCGRVRSGKDTIEWIKEVESRGAGEILIQSVDTDGRRRGFDIPLIGEAVSSVKIPVVAASGAGSLSDIVDMVKQCRPSGLALASSLHYGTVTVEQVKSSLEDCL